MANRSMTRSVLIVVLVFWAGALGVACSDRPTGPSTPEQQQLVLGTPMEGSVASGAPTDYELRLSQATEFTVRLDVLAGTVRVDVRDPTGATVVASVQAAAGSGSEGTAESGRLVGTANQQFTVVASGNGSYRITVQSGSSAANDQLILGEVYTGVLLTPHEVAAFSFQATEGDVMIGYVLVGPDADDTQSVTMSILGPPQGQTLATARSLGMANTHRYANSSVTAPLEASGTHFFTVTAQPTGYTGPYSFEVRKLDRAPENSPAMLPVNDTVRGEAIDYGRDIDEFILAGEPGEEFNILFRGVNLAPGASVRMLVERTRGEPLPFHSVVSQGPTGPLESSGTTVFALPESGQVYVSVNGGGLTFTGSYEMYVNKVNRPPEVAGAQIAVNEMVTSESIDSHGDIDEFQFSLDEPMRVNLVVARAPDTRGPLSARILLADDPASGFGTVVATGQGPVGMGPVSLPAGDYAVRLWGNPSSNGFVGGYTVAVLHVPVEPEDRPADFGIGEMVEETLYPLGDTDIFRFTTDAQEDIQILAQGLGSPDRSMIGLTLRPVGKLNLGQMYFPESTPSLDSHGTNRFRLQGPGAYEVVIDGSLSELHAGIPYRFQVRRYPTTTENHSGIIALNEVVVSEQLDVPGDIDDFLLTGSPGQEITAWLESGDWRMRMQLTDPATGELLAWAANGRNTPRFVLPPSGKLLARVYEDGETHFSVTGAYSLAVQAVDRRPETASAELVIGTPVANEDVTPGDVDEFWFDGVVGEKVEGLVRRLEGYYGVRLELEILAEGSETVLGIAPAPGTPMAAGDFDSTGSITLPHTGRYMVRLSGVDPTTDYGPYEFVIRYVP